MHAESSIARAAAAIVRTATKVPFLKFGDDSDALMLAYRKKGELISDEECDVDFEALQSGLYQRFTSISFPSEESSFRWMRLCHLDEDNVRGALIETFNSMTHVEIESLPMDAAWQSMQHEEASRRSVKPRSFARS